MSGNIADGNHAVKLVDALGGDLRSGMARCPAHDDERPSLHVSEISGKVVFHCFAGCSQSAVLRALRDRGLWPIGGAPTCSPQSRPTISPEERRAHALAILRDTEFLGGHEWAFILRDYFAARGIERVPPAAMVARAATSIKVFELKGRSPSSVLIPDGPAMVFPVENGREVVGAHVTWLSQNARAKRDPCLGPQRQFFGTVSGGYIKLYAGDLDLNSRLVIAEGIETALSAAQIGKGLPAIAALSAYNLPKIMPPPAKEYIVCADNDPPGLTGARALAAKLVRGGHFVRLAIPKRPGTDWNDYLVEHRE